MATIEGRDLAKMMQQLGDQVLRDLGEVEFDDGLSEEPMRVLSVGRDAIDVQIDGNPPKTLSRAIAAKGAIIDSSSILTKAISDALGEPFCRRAARLLGNPALESSVFASLGRYLRPEVDRFIVLPDDAVAIIAKFILKHDVPVAEVKKASSIARKLELHGLASMLDMKTVDFKLPSSDAFDAYLAEEAVRFFHYRDPAMPFMWPNSLWFDKDNTELAAKPVRLLSEGGYSFALPETERRQRLTFLFKAAPAADFDGTPARSCGRLRLIALALAWLWHNGASGHQTPADIWRADLYWLKDTFYKAPCTTI